MLFLYSMIKLIVLPTLPPGQPSELEMQIGSYLLAAFIIGIGILVYFLVKDRYQNRKWRRGVFPSKLVFDKDNFLRAYICLSANMMRRDNRQTLAKTVYANTFFKREFKSVGFDYHAALKFSLRYPIQIDTVCYWINFHVIDKRLKIQIIHLLVGIAMTDGGLVKNELWLLRELIRQLNLEQSDLDAILSIYFEEEQKSTLSKSKLSSRENALNILELDRNVSLKDIKKAYRKLVMIHHPDKFVNEGEEEVKLAEVRFLKIKEAYEFLIKI